MKINILSVSLILGIIAVAGVEMASASPTISIVPASITGLNQGMPYDCGCHRARIYHGS